MAYILDEDGVERCYGRGQTAELALNRMASAVQDEAVEEAEPKRN